MKKLTVSLLLIAAAGVVFGLTACGNSNGGGGAPAPAPGVCIGGNCVTIATNSSRGFYAQNQNMANQYNLAGMNDGRGSTLIVDPGFGMFLKDVMGICDRDKLNIGASDCTSWMNGFLDMIIAVNASSSTSGSATVVFRGQPYSMYNMQINYPTNLAEFLGVNYTPQGAFNPLSLNMTMNAANNNSQIELRSYGPAGSYGYNKLIRIVIEGQSVVDGAPYRIYVDSTQIAHGTLVQCTTNRCGNGL